MSVVVRMEMPEGCWDCPCVNGEYGYCQADEENRPIRDPSERPSWCPIICSLPDGHGRLIDGDKLMGEMKNRKWMIGRASDPDCLVFDAPTIVPSEAERSET